MNIGDQFNHIAWETVTIFKQEYEKLQRDHWILSYLKGIKAIDDLYIEEAEEAYEKRER